MKTGKAMKKVVLFIICAALAFTAYSNPREDKIKQLIKDHMRTSLYDFNSYEPVEYGEIETIYSNLKDDTNLEQMLKKAGEYEKATVEAVEKTDEAILIYGRGSSEHAAAFKQTEETYAKWKKITADMDSVVKAFVPQKIGVGIVHTFRKKTPEGNTVLTRKVYIFDDNIEKIIRIYDVD